MATGNRVLPGAPAMAAHVVTAGQAVTAEQAIRGGQAATAGQPMTSRATTAGSALPPGQAVADPMRLPGLGRGAGGRWFVWVLRVLLWAILLLIGYRGVAAIVTDHAAPRGAATGAVASPARGFPVSLAQAYALEFGQVYLSFSPATAAQRSGSLAAFLPPGTDPRLAGTGVGVQTLQSEQVAGVHVVSAHRALVTLLARVNGHLIELAVPVYATAAGLVVSGQPAILPPPAQVTPPPSPAVASDPVLGRTLMRQLPAFFRAFADGSAARLGGFTASGVRLSSLGGAVAFRAIRQLTVSRGGTTRQVVVTVSWRVVSSATAVRPQPSRSSAKGSARPAARPPTTYAQVVTTYAMTVVRSGGIWRVRSIGATAAQHWSPP
ncbi:MAG TPA: conjugal transfer protein [Streptosporangiaceae bacterium]